MLGNQKTMVREYKTKMYWFRIYEVESVKLEFIWWWDDYDKIYKNRIITILKQIIGLKEVLIN